MTVAAPIAIPAAATLRPLVLDVSRLMSRARHATPTGIDRVELAYARALLARRTAVRFETWLPGTGFASLTTPTVERLVGSIEARWRSGGGGNYAMRAITGLRPGRSRAADAVHLIVSHQHLAELDQPKRLPVRGKVCVYVHDTIPCDYPEYARPGGAERHARRMRNTVRLADALIVNSIATANALEPFMTAAGRRPPLLVAPLGIDPPAPSPAIPAVDDTPYFLCLGTIEPRKNHLLLLQVWRALVEQAAGGPVPRLVIAGRRGWENENVLDLLDRSYGLRGLVIEAGRVGDGELAQLIAGARAVLMPSFAEGFGLPVVEALSAGVPVIASDIPALRETGGAVAEYLHPLDGIGWMEAVRAYTPVDSPRRAAQLARLQGWRAPCWSDHFARVIPFLEAL